VRYIHQGRRAEERMNIHKGRQVDGGRSVDENEGSNMKKGKLHKKRT
jgi:hypothetical protein